MPEDTAGAHDHDDLRERSGTLRRVWRAGVDQVTTLTTEGDILVGGKKAPAGKYRVYTHAPEGGAPRLLIQALRARMVLMADGGVVGESTSERFFAP